MARKITKAQAAAVSRLAVAYNAYCEAVAREDANGVVVWGMMLKEAQAETGVTLRAVERIDAVVAAFRRVAAWKTAA